MGMRPKPELFKKEDTMTDQIVWDTPISKKPWLQTGHDPKKEFFFKKFCFIPNMDAEDRMNVAFHCANEIIIRTYLQLVKSTVTTFQYDIFVEPEGEAAKDIRRFMENRLHDKEALRNTCSDLRNDFANEIEKASVHGPLEITLKIEYGEPDVRNQIRDLANKPDSDQEILLLLEKLFELLVTADSISLLLLDLKPDNLIRTLRNKNETWVLNDFDVSRLMKNNEYPSGEAGLECTWPYAAPEQILRNAQLTSKTDVYPGSLIGYELLNDGELPKVLQCEKKHSVAVMDALKRGKQKIEPPRNGPEWLKELIMQGLSFDPEQRPKAKKILAEIQKHRKQKGGKSMSKTKFTAGDKSHNENVGGNKDDHSTKNSSSIIIAVVIAFMLIAFGLIWLASKFIDNNTGITSNAPEQTAATEMQTGTAPVSAAEAGNSIGTIAAGDADDASVQIENNGTIIGDFVMGNKIGTIDNSTHITQHKTNDVQVTPEQPSTPAPSVPSEETPQPDPVPETEPTTTQWYACSGETLTTVYSIPKDFCIPDGITVIGEGAFQGRAELQGRELDLRNIIRIEDHAFDGCSPSRVLLSTPLEYIGSHAFASALNTPIEFVYDSGWDDFHYVVHLGDMFPFGNSFHLTGVRFDSETDKYVMDWIQGISPGYRPS